MLGRFESGFSGRLTWKRMGYGKSGSDAWKSFKGKEQRVGAVWNREKAAKGMLIVAAHGGTPEWIRVMGTYGLVSAEDRCPCLVDRRALQAIVANWERWDCKLLVHFEDQKISDRMGAGEIKEIKSHTDGLWIRVEWTEAGLGCITRKEFGYLALEFILDDSNRPVELWQAKLTNYLGMNQGVQGPVLCCDREETETKVGRTLTLIKSGTG